MPNSKHPKNELGNICFRGTKLCCQARKAQTVLDLHVMKHPIMSVERAIQLFDCLIKPIVMFDSEVWGVENCGEIDKYFGSFLEKLLRVKQSVEMLYCPICVC